MIPLALGMWLRANREQRVEDIGPAFRRVAGVVFVGTVIGVIIAEHERVLENLDSVAAAVIALNVCRDDDLVLRSPGSRG